MQRSKIWIIMGILLATFGVIPNANASLFPTAYLLNVDYCTTGCLFGGIGGTVTLSPVGTGTGEVKVVADLTSATNTDLFFHDTTAFESFTFNLMDISSITISNLTAGFVGEGTTNAGSIHQDGAGTFEFGVDCSGCGTTANKIEFNVSASGLTTDSFHELSLGGGHPSYFSAAVFSTSLSLGCTGVIGADGGGSNETINGGTGKCSSSPPVPEPGTLLLLGSGLLGMGGFAWRRLR